MDINRFKDLYYACFDEHDDIMVCGRSKCRDLLCFLGDPVYGDMETGRLNLQAVVSLKNKLLGGDKT